MAFDFYPRSSDNLDPNKKHLPKNTSIFNAEVGPVDMALDRIQKSKNQIFFIFSDSLSMLQNKKLVNLLIIKLLCKIEKMSGDNEILIYWILSHTGISENKQADKVAWRCPWCNGYRRRKWTRRHEFKSWTRLIAFHIALIPLGKVWIQLFSLQLGVNRRTDWILQP